MAHEMGDSPTRVRKEWRDAGHAEETLDHIEAELESEGLAVSTSLLHAPSGEVGRVLLEEIRRVGPELVLVGVQRRTRVGKLLLGSVAQDLILGADGAVMTVKGPHENG